MPYKTYCQLKNSLNKETWVGKMAQQVNELHAKLSLHFQSLGLTWKKQGTISHMMSSCLYTVVHDSTYPHTYMHTK